MLALLACGEDAPDRAAVAEWDSAGVAMVEASPPYNTWSVDPTPVLRLGVVEGEPDYQFANVVHAARLSDGRVVVVDGGSAEVRWYGPDGGFRSRAGGSGEGPGEFQRTASGVLTATDALIVYDWRSRRLSRFGPDELFSGSRHVGVGSSLGVSLYALEGGRTLIAEERQSINLGGAEYNYARDTLLVLMGDSGGTRTANMDTILRLPGREAATWVDYVDGVPQSTRQFALPFGEVALAGGASDRIVVVAAGRHELAFFNDRGDLVRVARRTDVDPPAVSDAVRQVYVANAARQARAAGRPEAMARAAAVDRLALLPEGRHLPAYDRLLVDAVQGHIWLRDFSPDPGAEEAQTWTVHDPMGRVLTRVTTPAGLQVMHASPGHIVGVERDALDVEYVVVYAVQS